MERFFPGTKGFINLGKDSGGGGVSSSYLDIFTRRKIPISLGWLEQRCRNSLSAELGRCRSSSVKPSAGPRMASDIAPENNPK